MTGKGEKVKDLTELREEIDKIDRQITALYRQRMEIAADVAEYKIRTGKKIFDKEREESKLSALAALGDDAFNQNGIRELFGQIMSISRKKQYQLLTSRGISEKPDFEEVEKLDYEKARIVFQVLCISSTSSGSVRYILEVLPRILFAVFLTAGFK